MENSEFKPVKLRLKIDLVSHPTRAEGLVNMIVSTIQDDFIKEFGMTKEKGRLLWLGAPGMRCLSNNKASLTWLVIWNALWVAQETFLSASGNFPRVHPVCCYRKVDRTRLLSLLVVQPLCKLLKKITWFT